MMSETDPWITLGMDYDQCLGAFEGPFKEIHIVTETVKSPGLLFFRYAAHFQDIFRQYASEKITGERESEQNF